MSSRLFSLSLALNLVLLGVAGYWAARRQPVVSAVDATGAILQTSRQVRTTELASRSTDPATPVPLRWNELETEDYPTYVANLREVDCPEPVLRRIIEAEVRELYAQKGFASVHEFHRDFWEIAARENVREYFDKTLRQQVNAISEEPNALLKQLLGDRSPELPGEPIAEDPESRLTAFLPPAKQEQLRQLAERYQRQMQEIHHANLSPKKREFQLARVRREMENEQAQILSSEERVEYGLRQSSAATELQQLHGVDFSETELRNIAKAIDDFNRQADSQAETGPDTLEQNLQTVLGPERFADYSRARSASYRELYEVASDFSRPPETAAEVYDLRIESEKKCEEIRADRNRPSEEKQALLDELQEQVEQAVLTKFGANAYQSYKARHGRWISTLGRL